MLFSLPTSSMHHTSLPRSRRCVPPQTTICAASASKARPQRRSGKPGNKTPRQRRSNNDADKTQPQRSVLRWMELVERHRTRTPQSTRLAALEQLLRIEYEGAYVGMVGGSPTYPSEKPTTLTGRDARFVTEIVAGVTRMHKQLDYILAQLLQGKRLEGLDVPVHIILRIGLYEMLYMNTPAHAINEHVQTIKTLVRPAAASLVNGILRNVDRHQQANTLPMPPPPVPTSPLPDQAAALALQHSHPEWLLGLLVHQYGVEKTTQLAAANNTRPNHGVRVATGDPATVAAWLQEKLQVHARPSDLLPDAFVRVESNMQALLASEWMRTGGGQVQDESAGLVVAMLDPQPGHVVLDACAAPGGKTMYAAARMQGQGTIVAADINAARLKALARTAKKQDVLHMLRVCAADMAALPYSAVHAAGAIAASTSAATHRNAGSVNNSSSDDGSGNIHDDTNTSKNTSTTNAKLLDAQAVAGMRFDAVLADVPCTGSGVLAKRADLRWRRTKQQLKDLLVLQQRILDSVAPLVKPGGVLVYSTCSILALENEQQVDAFLQRHPDFEVAPVPEGVPGSVVNARGFMATFATEHGTDGAFAARLVRKE